jgi:hypothetical protein
MIQGWNFSTLISDSWSNDFEGVNLFSKSSSRGNDVFIPQKQWEPITSMPTLSVNFMNGANDNNNDGFHNNNFAFIDRLLFMLLL